MSHVAAASRASGNFGNPSLLHRPVQVAALAGLHRFFLSCAHGSIRKPFLLFRPVFWDVLLVAESGLALRPGALGSRVKVKSDKRRHKRRDLGRGGGRRGGEGRGGEREERKEG